MTATATRKYICVLDDDELLEPAAAEEVAEALHQRTGATNVVRSRSLEPTGEVARRAGQPTVLAGGPVTGMLSVWVTGPEAGCSEVLGQVVGPWLISEVQETVQLERPVEVASHLVRVGFIRRQAGLTRKEFGRHWNERHGPLVVEHRPLFDRYVTNVPTGDVPFDGLVEQWFRDRDTWEDHDRLVAQRKPTVAADADSFTAGFQQFAGREIATASNRSPS